MLGRLIRWVVTFYQRFISPARPVRVCRFEPTCSTYMLQAIDRFGSRGVLLGLARILRCQPFSAGGYDPVPAYFTFKNNTVSKAKGKHGKKRENN